MNKIIVAMTLLLLLSHEAVSRELNQQIVNGTYFLGIPERGKNQVLMQFGTLGNKTVIAVAACQKCQPAVYSLLPEETKTLGLPVFMTAGLYLIPYKDESFVLVQPDGLLGRKVWSKIGHANIYAKSEEAAKLVSRSDIEKFAIELSSKIMNQEVGALEHSSGKYFLAAPQEHMGKAQSSYDISFSSKGKKSITVKPCERCSEFIYQHLPEESGVIGIDVYLNSSSYYLFDLKDGVLIYTFANAAGFGKTLWTKHSNYNVYSNNQAYIRQILTSKEKQNTIDDMMKGFFMDVKEYFEQKAAEEKQKRDENRKLPNEGLIYSDKQELHDAAQAWASAWGWKETIVNSYLTQNDWSITRNRLTGVITGKIIAGVIVMKHPDGRCRYQVVNYRKDYDGSSYINLHVTGIGPIYDFACAKL